MPIKKKKIVEKVIAFEGEQDFILGNNKPEFISAGEVLYVDANGTNRLNPDSNELIPTNTSGSAPIRADTIQGATDPYNLTYNTNTNVASSGSTNVPTDSCSDYCILNTSGSVITIGSLEAYLGKKLTCTQTTFSAIPPNLNGTIRLIPSEVIALNPSANWEILPLPCPEPQNVTQCDASIDQFNITTDGTTATINTTIKQGTKSISGIVYSLDGGDFVLSQPTFILKNLSYGDHSLIVAVQCTDGSRIGKQTKSFTITKPTITPTSPKPIDPAIVDALTPKPTPTTTVTSTTTFVPPFTFGGGRPFGGGGGGGETQEVKVEKKSQFPLLLLLLIAGGLFLLTRDKENK
jgi:hypothetical protein